MNRLFLLLTLSFFVGFSFAEDELISIAILELIPEGVDSVVAVGLTERLRTEFLSHNDFTCIEQNQMQEILNENGFQDFDCSSNDCAIEIGQLLQVSYVIVGKIGRIGEMHTLHLRIIKVDIGKMAFMINKDCDCPIETVFSTTTKESIIEIVNALTKSRYSGLTITTTPPGADVFLNKIKIASTPYKNDKIEIGTYNIELKLDTYKTLKSSVVLEGGQHQELTFNLPRSQRYIDSLKTLDSLKAVKIAQEKAAAEAAAEKEKKKKKIKLVSRIALGSLTAGLFVGGIFMDSKVKDKMELKNQLNDDYVSTSDPVKCAQIEDEYNQAHQDGEDLSLYRAIFYISAGVTTAGFGVTFFIK